MTHRPMVRRTARLRGLLMTLTAMVVATSAAAKVSPATYAKLREETYQAAQGAVVSAAADAMTGVAARFAQGKGELAQLVGQRETLVHQIAALRKAITASSDAGGASLEAVAQRARSRTLRDSEAALTLRLDEIEKTIAEKYPAYAELTRPLPISAAATQALLKPDEALLLITPAPDATYIWIVTHERFDWARADLTEDQVTEAVRTLRRALDPSTATRGAVSGFGRVTSATGAPAASGKDFDRPTAFKLYQALIAPLESQFRTKKVLFVATTGALQSLPLSVLVTAEPKGGDAGHPPQTDWLIDRYALVTLPAVSSLRTLRCLSARGAAGLRRGCGDSSRAKAAPSAPAGVAYAGVGGPALGGDSTDGGRGAPGDWSAYSNGELADPEKLRALMPLPGAKAEIGAMADLFARRGAFTRTGADFTETLVKTSPEIRHAAVLHFATHALMTGETGRSGEPGLVLTPPAANAATAEDDGLLTASEAAALDIQADFVVLSACNTARADGTLGADGLSGLARGFFYAGAHSLLVSHWSVDDKSTKDLMVNLFQRLADDKVDRAVALQQAIQAVKREPAFEEPRFWAPFVLVGDTGA